MSSWFYSLTGLSLQDSEIIALSGLVISLCALVVAGAGVWWTKKYTIRAMRPVLVPSNSTKISKDGLTYTYEFGVNSVGAGPAIIIETRFYLKDELFKGGANRRYYPVDLVRQCFPIDRWPNNNIEVWPKIEKWGMMADGGALRPGERHLLIRLHFRFDTPPIAEDIDKLEKLIDQAGYQVDYTSIYDDGKRTCSP